MDVAPGIAVLAMRPRCARLDARAREWCEAARAAEEWILPWLRRRFPA